MAVVSKLVKKGKIELYTKGETVHKQHKTENKQNRYQNVLDKKTNIKMSKLRNTITLIRI
jgi:hypothetical protein